MNNKTRYLQLSITTMFEYNINENTNAQTPTDDGTLEYLVSSLKNGRRIAIMPMSYEFILNNETGHYDKRKTNVSSVYDDKEKIISINTLSHTAVPCDAKENNWFIFNDPDYKYVNEYNIETLDSSIYDERTRMYDEYTESSFEYHSTEISENIQFNTAKLYFASGYDFSDTYGALLRLSVQCNDDSMLDLCSFYYDKSNIWRYIKFLSKPIIFGNVIYDKYLELNIISPESVYEATNSEINRILNIKHNTPLKLMFAYIDDDDIDFDLPNYSLLETLYDKDQIKDDKVSCIFTRTNVLNGALPTSQLTSDNLGVYIAADATYPYFKYYGTWKNMPLTTTIVHAFNLDIPLYNRDFIRNGTTTYEVDKEYSPDYNAKKWIANHEITCTLVGKDNVIYKQEEYTQTQLFLDNDVHMFYYRPVFFDESTKDIINFEECVMVIDYMMRFMNVEDSVQFTKSCSLEVHGNDLKRFIGGTSQLKFYDYQPYKIYNKIIKQTQEITPNSNVSSGIKTKYVKVFYESTNIVLEYDGTISSNGSYTLELSQVPKNYKFIFKQKDINNNLKYMDLTDSYYKLYCRDAYNNEIIIEPTYSKNMNLLFGELEFSINQSILNKLADVQDSSRKISIVAYNSDNSISSLYDMKYSFL